MIEVQIHVIKTVVSFAYVIIYNGGFPSWLLITNCICDWTKNSKYFWLTNLLSILETAIRVIGAGINYSTRVRAHDKK